MLIGKNHNFVQREITNLDMLLDDELRMMIGISHHFVQREITKY